jgi:hypothetical protein
MASLRSFITGVLLLVASSAFAVSGVLDFTSFSHNADPNFSTDYGGFTFGPAWFDNPKTELRDPYLALSTNGGARSNLIQRADHSAFTLDSFTYGGRSNGGVAYLVMYNGANTVFSGTTNNAGKLQFRSPIDVPGGATLNVASSTGYTGQITAFAFAFKTPGGGFGDGSDSNQFLFDNVAFSNATATPVPPLPAVPLPAVPEPSVYLLFLAGLGALIFKAKRM